MSAYEQFKKYDLTFDIDNKLWDNYINVKSQEYKYIDKTEEEGFNDCLGKLEILLFENIPDMACDIVDDLRLEIEKYIFKNNKNYTEGYFKCYKDWDDAFIEVAKQGMNSKDIWIVHKVEFECYEPNRVPLKYLFEECYNDKGIRWLYYDYDKTKEYDKAKEYYDNLINTWNTRAYKYKGNVFYNATTYALEHRRVYYEDNEPHLSIDNVDKYLYDTLEYDIKEINIIEEEK